MNNRLLGVLRKWEWLCRNDFEQAQAANKAAYDNKTAYPFLERQMVQLELAWLRVQAELAREESKNEPGEE
jgi:hypothetical protein